MAGSVVVFLFFFIFYFGCDWCLKEVVDMAEVSYGSWRSEWVIAWVTEIEVG